MLLLLPLPLLLPILLLLLPLLLLLLLIRLLLVRQFAPHRPIAILLPVVSVGAAAATATATANIVAAATATATVVAAHTVAVGQAVCTTPTYRNFISSSWEAQLQERCLQARFYLKVCKQLAPPAARKKHVACPTHG